jgi:hypothetical protein
LEGRDGHLYSADHDEYDLHSIIGSISKIRESRFITAATGNVIKLAVANLCGRSSGHKGMSGEEQKSL